MVFYSGDEVYDDDVTSGPIEEDDFTQLCKNCGTVNVVDGESYCQDCLDEAAEDYEPDPEVEERKAIFNEVMERHPDFAFTGASVTDYIYNGGELESATIEDPMRYEY